MKLKKKIIELHVIVRGLYEQVFLFTQRIIEIAAYLNYSNIITIHIEINKIIINFFLKPSKLGYLA